MKRRSLQKFCLNLVLILAALFFIAPFLIMIFGSLKTAGELAANPGGIPHQPTFENYVKLYFYASGRVVRAFLNSIYIAVVHTGLTVVLSALAAYAFAKYRFKGSNVLFFCIIGTMMIPIELTIPPLYIFFSRIHWLNSFAVQMIPGTASAFGMFLVRQYMTTIPDSLIEAARIDGAGHLKTFFRVILPVSKPVVGVLALLTFLTKWNDYLWPLMFVSQPEKQPIMVILPTLNISNSVWSIPWELVLAGCVVVTLPLVLLFLRYQETFMSSVTVGAVKG